MKIESLDVGDLPRLEPLWLELHAHHQAVAPELAPYVDDEVSWSRRRALYAKVLAGGGFALVARDGDADIAYAVAATEPAPWPATFATDAEVAELLTLSVRRELRGRGVGSALLDAVEARMQAEGHGDRVIGVVPANTRAAALYERRGYVPTWLTLTRFGRPPAVSAPSAPVPVEPVGAGEIDTLAPLWLSLLRHHRAVAPSLGPFSSDDASWEFVRGKLPLLAEGGLLLRAGPAARPLALTLVSITRDDPLWADTWQTGRDVAEIRLLVVDDAARGAGLGSALLDAIDRTLGEAGVTDQVVGAIEPNTAAIRLYKRRGFRPAWLQLSRFARRLPTR